MPEFFTSFFQVRSYKEKLRRTVLATKSPAASCPDGSGHYKPQRGGGEKKRKQKKKHKESDMD